MDSRTRRSIGVAVALVLGVGVLGIGIASGQTSDDTYTGCLRPTGKLVKVRVGDDPLAPCIGPAVEVSWGEIGPRGPRGFQGDFGPRGPEGPTGPSGTDGEDGESPVVRATWNAHFGGGIAANIESTDVILPGETVRAVSANVAGNFGDCQDGFIQVDFPGAPNNQSYTLALIQISNGDPAQGPFDTDPHIQENFSGVTMEIHGGCFDPPNTALPEFNLTFVFDWTRTPPPAAFS